MLSGTIPANWERSSGAERGIDGAAGKPGQKTSRGRRFKSVRFHECFVVKLSMPWDVTRGTPGETTISREGVFYDYPEK